MGTVYLARHTVLNRQVAVKVIRESLIRDAGIDAMFRQEARAASRVVHHHVAAVFDFGHTADGRPYLVMEYADGPTLHQTIAGQHQLPLARALYILNQIAVGIAAAHSCNVVHRDLKPQNVILTTHHGQQDFVKILDFGMAKIVGSATTANLIAEGMTCGTAEYMSPEQFLAKPLDYRSDIYSFGVMAFEVLTGRVPFVGAAVEIATAHIETEPPALSGVRNDLPLAVEGLVLRCLSKDPEERYQDAAAIADDLRMQRCEIGQLPGWKRLKSGLVFVDTPSGTELPPESRDTVPPLVSSNRGEPQSRRPGGTDKGTGAVESPEQRSTRVEELACAVRDRGVGSPEISHVLALKIATEDQLLELESQIAALDRHRVELEITAREREARLTQALIPLEQEQARLAGAQPSPQLETIAGRLEETARAIIGAMRNVSTRADEELSALKDRRQQLRRSLDERRVVEVKLSEKLNSLLRRARAELADSFDPQIERLFDDAGID